jgi:hypothetical protein
VSTQSPDAGIVLPRDLYDLRHTYAAFAPRAGMPVFAISTFILSLSGVATVTRRGVHRASTTGAIAGS